MSNTPTRSVIAFGMHTLVPEGMSWVAITRLHLGQASSLALVAFEAEPVYVKSGRWVAQENTDFSVLKMLDGDTNKNLSSYLVNLDAENALITNAHETVERLSAILDDEQTSEEEKIHLIYCPEHGLLPEWLDATKALLQEEDVDYAATNEQPEAEEQHPPALEELIKFFEAQGLKVIAKRG